MLRDDEIFADALDLPPEARAAYLDRVCGGDSAQRQRIEALLTGSEAANGFLDEPLAARPPVRREEKPGDVIGRYTLLEKIGEGGCGVVYLAEQKEPVRRRVALKVIKLGMDTRQVIARFEAERQALAMMAHPDIARVFDAGATDTGRPYFVMEYVDGAPITKFCDEHRLPMAARLELFARVCLALQHAHQKGVIHRDLKPSNILVALHDGAPAPKVIDFGIAKATEGRLTEHTLFTGFDQFLGTPAYMSPEQAELRDGDIDTRSDVYSLGVLLYELLTGRPPFDPKTLVQAGVNEIRRIIREVEPPRPSTCVSTLGNADRITIAQCRRAGAAQLTSVLRGDLDWIVMRCLEKHRTRRYSTAHALADDVRRHLRSEPVSARPPQALYRVRKFVMRNRLACASAAAVATALVIGTFVSATQAVRAKRAESATRAERDLAVAAQRAEAVAREDAQRRQEQAEDLLTFMLGDFRTELQKIGRLPLLDAVGDKAMAYFAALDPRDLTDAALTRQAKALTQIGEVRMTEARYPDAAAAYTTAYQRAAALVTRHPADADMLFERAQAEFGIGFVNQRSGQLAAAMEWLTRYRDSSLDLARLEPDSARSHLEVRASAQNLATLALNRGDLLAARAGFTATLAEVERLLASSPDDPALGFSKADVNSYLGEVAERSGQLAEARDRYAAQSAELRSLVTREPATAKWRYFLADSLRFQATVLGVSNAIPAAQLRLQEALPIIDALVAQDPSNRQWELLGISLRLQGARYLIAAGDLAAAHREAEAARKKLSLMTSTSAPKRAFTSVLMMAWRLEAQCWEADHRPEATEAISNATKLGGALINEGFADDRTIGECARTFVLAGRILAPTDAPAAAGSWNSALQLLGTRIRESNDWRLLDPAARAHALLGHRTESGALISRLTAIGYRPLDPWP